jgi:hypothetical protein
MIELVDDRPLLPDDLPVGDVLLFRSREFTAGRDLLVRR